MLRGASGTEWHKMDDFHPDDEDIRLLRVERVLDLIPVSKNTLYRLIAADKFPAPYKLLGTSVWSNEEIRDWLIDENSRRPGYNQKIKTPIKAAKRREIEDLA